MRIIWAALLCSSLALTACVAANPLSVIGDQCDKNTDCQAPLVCGLGRCRNECEVPRDCPLGLRCIKLPAPSTFGVCQLPGEETCTEGSCESPLACFTEGGCLLPCNETNTCIAGETCESGQCTPPEEGVLCTHNSHCDYPQVCRLQVCAQDCFEDVDCRTFDVRLVCVQHESCDGPCACRLPCSFGCPTGTTCVSDGEREYCELDDPTGMGG